MTNDPRRRDPDERQTPDEDADDRTLTEQEDDEADDTGLPGPVYDV